MINTDADRMLLIADVAMMNYARFTTVRAVSGLETEQLDYKHDEKSNSIAIH